MHQKPLALLTAFVIGVLLATHPVVAGAAAKFTGADIKNGTITGRDVENHSLKAKDLAAGVVPEGPPAYMRVVNLSPGDINGPTTPRRIISLDVPPGSYHVSFHTEVVALEYQPPFKGSMGCEIGRGVGSVQSYIDTMSGWTPEDGTAGFVNYVSLIRLPAGGPLVISCTGNLNYGLARLTAVRVTTDTALEPNGTCGCGEADPVDEPHDARSIR